MAEFEDDREAAQQKAFDAILRHALAVERNNNGLVADMRAVIDKAGKTLSVELLDRLDNLTPGELTALSRYRVGQRTDRLPTRVQGVVKAIESWASSIDEAIIETWSREAQDFVQAEVDFTNDLMAGVLVEASAAAVSAAEVYHQAMETPALGMFVEEALRGVSTTTKDRVYAKIREGVTQGWTNTEIIRALRGTKALNFRDGVLQTTRNDLSSIVRTGRNHLSTTAYDQTYRALGVEEVVFVATIDGRTCLVEGSLIDTPQGKRPIELLRAGDEVMGGSGQVKQVRATRKAKSRKLCRVTLSNGEVVTCTQDHRFWTSRGWVEAKDLVAGENLPDKL